MSNIKLSKQEAQKKVYELTEKLLHTKKDFKDVSSGYKERIKELESEIKAVVEDATFGFRAAAPALACNESYFSKKIIHWDPIKMKLLK